MGFLILGVAASRQPASRHGNRGAVRHGASAGARPRQHDCRSGSGETLVPAPAGSTSVGRGDLGPEPPCDIQGVWQAR
ncbi:hypothetical protein PR002_g22290 [Phytophthora rubi]|uniref:Uncharacterized protein n=1 Tax=Phytophthora rubi TaxID=129364 RepID=A0A6A3IUB8_9STRA|nr:hypothetical protein PR002_g22290 [Phytophthora rubi]